MLRHAFRATSLCVLFLAAVWGLPAYAISKDFNQSYPLQPGGTFELQNVNGTVEVNARLDAISVATRYPQNEGVEVAVEYIVHVPHFAHLEHLATVNGTLRVAGVDTVEDLHTVNGNIEVFEAGGSVHAHTTNGNVHLELTRLREKDKNGATAETTNGSLVLAVPSDMQADVEARCLNGNFFSELPVTMESTQRPREMRGKLGRGGAPIHLRTVNGGIRLIVLRSTV